MVDCATEQKREVFLVHTICTVIILRTYVTGFEKRDLITQIMNLIFMYMCVSVWRVMNKIGSDKCQTNHKVGQILARSEVCSNKIRIFARSEVATKTLLRVNGLTIYSVCSTLVTAFAVM